MKQAVLFLVLGIVGVGCVQSKAVRENEVSGVIGVTLRFLAYTNANGYTSALFLASNSVKRVVRCSPHHQFEFQSPTGAVHQMIMVENPGWPGYAYPTSPRLGFSQTAVLKIDGPPPSQQQWRVAFWVYEDHTTNNRGSWVWSDLVEPKR